MDTARPDINKPELRPVFDPQLSSRVTARLGRHPHKLYPHSRAPHRWPASRVSQVTAGIAVPATCAALVPLAVWSGTAAALFLAAFAVLPAMAVWRAFGEQDETAAMAASVTFLLAGGLLMALAVGTELGAGLLAAGLLLLGGAGAAVAMLRPDTVNLLASVHKDHYLIPDDFDPPERGVLLAVQRAIDQVREGVQVLDGSFDGRASLALLREQEWSLAHSLLRYQQRRRELDRRCKEAVSDRVIEALQPQVEALQVAHRTIADRVNDIVTYGESVHAAVVAHREWEQCLEIAEHNSDYADLVAFSNTDPTAPETLRQESIQAQAARQVRDERVREAATAGKWLSEAVNRPS